MEGGQGEGGGSDDHRESGGGAIRQYFSPPSLCIGENGPEWSLDRQFKGRERMKTLEVIQVKLYATPPATRRPLLYGSLARSLYGDMSCLLLTRQIFPHFTHALFTLSPLSGFIHMGRS